MKKILPLVNPMISSGIRFSFNLSARQADILIESHTNCSGICWSSLLKNTLDIKFLHWGNRFTERSLSSLFLLFNSNYL